MHRHAALDTDADRRDLVLGERSAHPDAAAALDAVPLDAEAGEDVDQYALEAPHVRHDIDRFAQAHDGISDELTGTVPCDLAATVDVDHGGAVGRPLVPRRARARREDGLVLEQQQRVGARAADHIGVDLTLSCPRVGVGDEGRGESHRLDVEHDAPSHWFVYRVQQYALATVTV